MTLILQDKIPYDVSTKSLPGVSPLRMEDWIWQDDAFAGQMALRDELIATRRDDVIAMQEGSEDAAQELLDMVVLWLGAHAEGYRVETTQVTRPDQKTVPLDCTAPMVTLGQLVQEDLCVLQKHGDEHVLTAAALCFPANWHLSQKIGRPLTTIHDPVPNYDAKIAQRVQRLFDGVQPDRPLWRFNALHYADPELFQPERRHGEYQGLHAAVFPYFRSERQCVLRLPKTRACVFSIHTFVIAKSMAPGEENDA
ncbi:heme-dependent oxidative N-demethylase family protein [Roseovarius phycicola]|uniref:DUF3445 domain-containing protein n=1 Tax=Roseovarius phycicola TaxID=3080976 RepID=A0ABZ2HG95_9RHOB